MQGSRSSLDVVPCRDVRPINTSPTAYWALCKQMNMLYEFMLSSPLGVGWNLDPFPSLKIKKDDYHPITLPDCSFQISPINAEPVRMKDMSQVQQ